MTVKEYNKKLVFEPVSYQFPELSKDSKHYDEWDSNWITMRFSFSDGKDICGAEDSSCVLSYEMTDFIDDLRSVCEGLSSFAELKTMEPYFKIKINKKQNVFSASFRFYYFVPGINGLKLFTIETKYDKEALERFITELEKEFSRFPKR